MKIDDWPKVQCFFFKYLSPQISLKSESVLKTDLWLSVLKWDRPQPFRLLSYGKIRQNHGAIFLKQIKILHHGFCLIFPKIKSSFGWGQPHMKPDIKSSVLSTQPFFMDIYRLRYLKKSLELLVNNLFSIQIRTLLKSKTKKIKWWKMC